MLNYDIFKSFDQVWLGYVKLVVLNVTKLAPGRGGQKSVRMSSCFETAITLCDANIIM